MIINNQDPENSLVPRPTQINCISCQDNAESIEQIKLMVKNQSEMFKNLTEKVDKILNLMHRQPSEIQTFPLGDNIFEAIKNIDKKKCDMKKYLLNSHIINDSYKMNSSLFNHITENEENDKELIRKNKNYIKLFNEIAQSKGIDTKITLKSAQHQFDKHLRIALNLKGENQVFINKIRQHQWKCLDPKLKHVFERMYQNNLIQQQTKIIQSINTLFQSKFQCKTCKNKFAKLELLAQHEQSNLCQIQNV